MAYDLNIATRTLMETEDAKAENGWYEGVPPEEELRQSFDWVEELVMRPGQVCQQDRLTLAITVHPDSYDVSLGQKLQDQVSGLGSISSGSSRGWIFRRGGVPSRHLVDFHGHVGFSTACITMTGR